MANTQTPPKFHIVDDVIETTTPLDGLFVLACSAFLMARGIWWALS